MNTYTFTKAMHGPLYKRYHLKEGRMVDVGDTKGQFGPEDRATGAEYKALSAGERNGRPLISRDYQAGAFYSATVFLSGKDDSGVNIPFEALEAFAKKLGYTAHKRVILPNGWNGKGWTWDWALCFVPPERAPLWYGLEKWLKGRLPEMQTYDAGGYIELYDESLANTPK